MYESMKKVPIAKIIRIERLQRKHKMYGWAFNPSGITDEQIREREAKFVAEFKCKTREERQSYWDQVQEILDYRDKTNTRCSWEWEWCCFKRNFVRGKEVV